MHMSSDLGGLTVTVTDPRKAGSTCGWALGTEDTRCGIEPVLV